jgi:hypothetical protein
MTVPKMILNVEQQAEYKAFMTAVKGFTAWQVARALNSLQRGVDYRKCAKGHMAEIWAIRKDAKPWYGTQLKKRTLGDLMKAIENISPPPFRR